MVKRIVFETIIRGFKPLSHSHLIIIEGGDFIYVTVSELVYETVSKTVVEMRVSSNLTCDTSPKGQIFIIYIPLFPLDFSQV